MAHDNMNLFDSPDDFKLGTGVEVVSFLTQQQLQIASHVSAGHVGPHHAVWHRETLVDWYRVRHAVACVQYYTGRAPRSIPSTMTPEHVFSLLTACLAIHCYSE